MGQTSNLACVQPIDMCVCMCNSAVSRTHTLALFLFMCVNNVPSFILKLTHSITTFSEFFRNHQICVASLAVAHREWVCNVFTHHHSEHSISIFFTWHSFFWGWRGRMGCGDASLYKCWQFFKPKNLQLDSNAFERKRDVSQLMCVFLSLFLLFFSTCIHSFGYTTHCTHGVLIMRSSVV